MKQYKVRYTWLNANGFVDTFSKSTVVSAKNFEDAYHQVKKMDGTFSVRVLMIEEL